MRWCPTWPWTLSLAVFMAGGAAASAPEQSVARTEAREVAILEQAKSRFKDLVLDHLAKAVYQPPNGRLRGERARTARYCRDILTALLDTQFTMFPEPQAKSSQAGLQALGKAWAGKLADERACQPQRRVAERMAEGTDLPGGPSVDRTMWLYTSEGGVAWLDFDLGSGRLVAWAQPRRCTSSPVEFGPALKAEYGQALMGSFEDLAYAVIEVAGRLHLAVGGVLWMDGSNLAWRDAPFLSLRAGRMEQLTAQGVDWPEDGTGEEPTDEQKALMKGRVLAVYSLDAPWLPGSRNAEFRDGMAYGPCLWNLQD